MPCAINVDLYGVLVLAAVEAGQDRATAARKVVSDRNPSSLQAGLEQDS